MSINSTTNRLLLVWAVVLLSACGASLQTIKDLEADGNALALFNAYASVFGDDASNDAAHDALIRLGKPSADTALQKIHSGDWNTRYHAYIVLGDLRERRAVKPLLHMLEHEPQAQIRLFITSALIKIADPESIPALKKLSDSRKSQVRAEARIALREIEQKLENIPRTTRGNSQ